MWLLQDFKKITELKNDNQNNEHKLKKQNIKIIAEISMLKTTHLDLKKDYYLLEDKYMELEQTQNAKFSQDNQKEMMSDSNSKSTKGKIDGSKQVRFKDDTRL